MQAPVFGLDTKKRFLSFFFVCSSGHPLLLYEHSLVAEAFLSSLGQFVRLSRLVFILVPQAWKGALCAYPLSCNLYIEGKTENRNPKKKNKRKIRLLV